MGLAVGPVAISPCAAGLCSFTRVGTKKFSSRKLRTYVPRASRPQAARNEPPCPNFNEDPTGGCGSGVWRRTYVPPQKTYPLNCAVPTLAKNRVLGAILSSLRRMPQFSCPFAGETRQGTSLLPQGPLLQKTLRDDTSPWAQLVLSARRPLAPGPGP